MKQLSAFGVHSRHSAFGLVRRFATGPLRGRRELLTVVVLAISLAACGASIKVEPVQVQPIHVTVDVNLKDSDTPATTPHAK